MTEVLLAHPAVRDAAVFAVPHPRLGHAVAALLHADSGADLEDVLSFARRRLAGFKVPVHAHLVPEVPRTSVGKVDLRRARQVAAEALSAAPHPGTPTSPTR